MPSKAIKLFSRLKTVSLYGAGKLTSNFLQLLVSYIIIKSHSATLWGEYIALLLWVNLIIILPYYGNKNFLLKLFSENPMQMGNAWRTCLGSRSVLFLLSIILLFFIPHSNNNWTIILAWSFLLFYNQSFDVLVLYNKHFKFSLLVEFISNALILVFLICFLDQLNLGLFLFFIVLGHLLKACCYTVRYLGMFKNFKARIDLLHLYKASPFFIPLLLGTLRIKIDAYYGTVFFDRAQLGKYQIFISLITVAQMGTSYMINPYLKNFYRLGTHTLYKIQRQSIYGGGIIALLLLPILYFAIAYIYGFDFTILSYALAMLFASTLLLHLLLVQEFYKRNWQSSFAVIIAITTGIQLFFGYYLILNYGIEGGLITKTLGQLIVVIALLVTRAKKLKQGESRSV